MPLLPVRELGKAGVITDKSPYNLPATAFSRAVNVRFDEGKVSRAPVFRSVKDSLGFTPRHAHGIVPATGFDTLIVCTDDYQIKEYANGTITDRSGVISTNNDPRPYTSTDLADVNYINRPDKVPHFRLPSGTDFAALTNWPSTYRCASLRSYGDFLIALNTTEGSNQFPTRVRHSNITLANSIPDSWDETDTTKSAGFNDLVQMQTEIIDGQTLNSNFIIYSSDQVWRMEFVGGQFIFNFRKLFTDSGIINQNCVVEVEGKHYVFDNSDIYIHDGVTKKSICDERVKNFVFRGLNYNNRNRCFVHHNSSLNEVYFCYQSGDDLVSFTNSDRCNRAAVYNYRNDSWSFMDLPNVSSSTEININTVTTYANSGSLTYDKVGGSYYDQEDSFERHSVMVGEANTDDGLTSDKIFAVDLNDTGRVAFQRDNAATKPVVLERVGLDLDELSQPLTGYKIISSIYPQALSLNEDKTMIFEFGASDHPNLSPTYLSSSTFTIDTDHKIDSRASGRYLSYKISFSDFKDFEFSGFDVNVKTTGRR